MNKYLNRLAEQIADKVGSPLSILIHTILFIGTFMLMLWVDVNRVLLILTVWVSLETAYLQLFTQLVVTNAKKKGK